MENLQQQKQAGLISNIGSRLTEGRVVDNKDPEGLGRVRVEIQGKTDEESVENLPWLDLMLPLHLGASAYTSSFGIPQINTQVVVLFADDNMRSGYVIGAKLNRKSLPNDPAKVSEPYKHPQSSEHHYTEAWDTENTTQTSFSNDFTQDYRYCWGWVDNAKNWFKVNMVKRCVEFVTNGLLKFKSYANGDTVVHIPGNFKLVVDGDVYFEVRKNMDKIVLNNQYDHTLGNRESQIEGTELRKSNTVIIDQGGPNIYGN